VKLRFFMNKSFMASIDFKKIGRLLTSEFTFIILLLAIIFVSYGLHLSKLGFYWDDWETVHLARQNSITAYWNYFIFDRPLSIWTQMLLVPFLKMNPLLWQLFGILMRWVNSILLFYTLKQFFPKSLWLVYWSALLLAIYPGFQQQSVSATYSRYLLLANLFFFSLWLMSRAIRKPSHHVLITLGANFVGILQSLSQEYFASLELIRPVILYFHYRQEENSRLDSLKKAIQAWLPYTIIPIIFLVYRFGILPGILPEEPHPLIWLQEFLANPVGVIRNFFVVIITNTIYTSLSVWIQQLNPEELLLSQQKSLFSWFIGGLVGLFVLGFGYILNQQGKCQKSSLSQSGRFSLLGLFALLSGLLPILILGREPLVGKWSDRLILPAMFGCVILLVSLVNLTKMHRVSQVLLFSIFTVMAVRGHVVTTQNYATDWANFKSYLWQVAWRIPAMEEKTVLISPNLPFDKMAGYSVGLAIDQIYGSGTDLSAPDYWWSEAEYLNFDSIDRYLTVRLRNIQFDASRDDIIVLVSGNADSCMHMIDDIFIGTKLIGNNPDILSQVIPFTQLDRIILPITPVTLPFDVYGAEPPHSWCYYFQKADLARQQQDWHTVLLMYEQAKQQGFWADNNAELLPLIEAYLQTGNWSFAQHETLQAMDLTKFYNVDAFCASWQNFPNRAIQADLALQSGYLQARDGIFQALNCSGE
jgi:hypothetical protein